MKKSTRTLAITPHKVPTTAGAAFPSPSETPAERPTIINIKAAMTKPTHAPIVMFSSPFVFWV
jgi:hypothetical protein